MKQKQNENLGDYSPRFNNAKDTYTLPGLSLPTEELLRSLTSKGMIHQKFWTY